MLKTVCLSESRDQFDVRLFMDSLRSQRRSNVCNKLAINNSKSEVRQYLVTYGLEVTGDLWTTMKSMCGVWCTSNNANDTTNILHPNDPRGRSGRTED